MELGDETGQFGSWISDGAAEDPRVQVEGGAGQFDLTAGDTAQAVRESGHAGGDHAGIGDGHHITGELVAVSGQERTEIRATNFLFAFKKCDQIDGQVTVGGHRLAQAIGVGHELPFVVSGAAGENDAILDARLEWGSEPEIQRVSGLHVVVTIQQYGRASRAVGVAGYDDGVSRGRVNGGVETGVLEKSSQPLGAGADVFSVGRISGDTGESQTGEQGIKRSHSHERMEDEGG